MLVCFAEIVTNIKPTQTSRYFVDNITIGFFFENCMFINNKNAFQ